jgi:hypothetical protein
MTSRLKVAILTQDDIGLGRLVLQHLGVIEAAEYDPDVGILGLNHIRFVLRADQGRVLVLGVCLVQHIECVASDVTRYAGARIALSVLL